MGMQPTNDLIRGGLRQSRPDSCCPEKQGSWWRTVNQSVTVTRSWSIPITVMIRHINSVRPGKNNRHFADISKWNKFFMLWFYYMWILFWSLALIDSTLALQVMAGCKKNYLHQRLPGSPNLNELTLFDLGRRCLGNCIDFGFIIIVVLNIVHTFDVSLYFLPNPSLDWRESWLHWLWDCLRLVFVKLHWISSLIYPQQRTCIHHPLIPCLYFLKKSLIQAILEKVNFLKIYNIHKYIFWYYKNGHQIKITYLLTLDMWGLSYSGSMLSISWLLMPCVIEECHIKCYWTDFT